VEARERQAGSMTALAKGAIAHGHDLDDSARRICPRFPSIVGGTGARSRSPRWISKLSTTGAFMTLCRRG
jgi:hypothetical protein